MCGFVTIHSSGRLLDDRMTTIDQMLLKIAHRGPDGEGKVHLPRQALLGHRRLAIIDVENGAQPMCSNDGRYSLVFNGEIYNYLELRQMLVLQGERFTTFSDTEVLFKLLILYGSGAIQKLNGMFAFVFHDRKTNGWIAARDPFGIKPLYYAVLGDELVFASEIKALLQHPKIVSARDNIGLHQYLAFQFCLQERTLFLHINKVQPGFYLSGQGALIEKKVCYWDASYEIDSDHSADYFVESVRSLVEDSIRKQTRADVPLGAYVSGGIDSSLICSVAAQYAGGPMPMFHGRFAEGIQFDESEYAKEVVSKSGGSYFEIVPTAKDFVDSLPGLIYTLDEPIAGPGVFPQFAVSRLASQHVKVVLGGQGGDEVFGGYARYLVGYLEQALKGAIFETQEEGVHLVGLASIVPQLSLLKEYKPLLSQFWSSGLFDNMDARYFHLIDRSQGLGSILNSDLYESFDQAQLFSEFQAVFNHPRTESYFNKMTNFDQKTLLPALLQIEDRVSMAVSLESRVPLLDTRLVDLVASMPPAFKFKDGKLKQVLKNAVRNIVPQSVLLRKDKMGFPVPLQEWMKGGVVRDFVGDHLLSTRSLQRGIFKPKVLYKMLDQQGVGARQLWGALSLELWHQCFMDAS